MIESPGQESAKSMKEKNYELTRKKIYALIRKKIYALIRNDIKRKLTRNLGKVVEEEDKLICYVDKKKIKKTRYESTVYCYGIIEKNKDLADYYKQNKPIVYILDGIELKNKNIHIHGYDNCEVIIKNCKFDYSLYLSINGKCTLDNTTINTFLPLTIGANELVIKNMNITNQYKLAGKKLPIYIGATNKLEINNSTIGDFTSNVDISSNNKLEVYNSSLIGETITCDATKAIFGKKSTIKAKKETKLKIKDFSEINITSPTIISNGNLSITNNQPVILRKIIDSVKLKRIELIYLLKELKSKIDTKNKTELEEYQSKLNNKPIVKVLSKEFINN